MITIGNVKMIYKNYSASVEFDDEAEVFHGRVHLTRDVMTFEGRSVEELKREFAASIEDYLAFCQQRGEMPETPMIEVARAA